MQRYTNNALYLLWLSHQLNPLAKYFLEILKIVSRSIPKRLRQTLLSLLYIFYSNYQITDTKLSVTNGDFSTKISKESFAFHRYYRCSLTSRSSVPPYSFRFTFVAVSPRTNDTHRALNAIKCFEHGTCSLIVTQPRNVQHLRRNSRSSRHRRFYVPVIWDLHGPDNMSAKFESVLTIPGRSLGLRLLMRLIIIVACKLAMVRRTETTSNGM